MTSETWHGPEAEEGTYGYYDLGGVQVNLPHAIGRKVLADHEAAQWAREHGQPALGDARRNIAQVEDEPQTPEQAVNHPLMFAMYRLDVALVEYAKLSQPESAEGTGR